MLTKSITRNGREYYCASEAARLAYISVSTLARYARRGLPYVTVLGRKWYNLGDVMQFFPGREIPETIYKRDDFEIDGRLYHPFRWYHERYGVWDYQLTDLPRVKYGGRMRLIAEDDFAQSDWARERGK